MRKRFSLILATALLCVGNLVAQISSLPVPIGETKWRTLMAPVTLEIPDGITAYTVPSVSDGYVNLVEIAGEFIPANVPVLLQADAAGDYEFLIASGEFEVGDNLLEGTIAKKYVSMSPDYNYYVFDEGECVWLPAVSIEEMEDCFSAEAHTAYLQVPTTMAESYSSLSIATVTASGSCGENLTWMLTAEGELIVEGTGEITSIPWRDFKGTITKVTLSAGVTGTVSYAFEGCSSLTTVNIPENSQLINIETAMFQNCSSLASITIPMSVTSIGYYAFDGCSSLASITIPKSVAEIANYAFRNCGGLTSITIKSTTPPTIGYYSFVGVDMFVYVPTGSVAAYKEAEHWSEFANIQAIVSLVSSGTCGDNLTWELTDDGKLTIEGTGAMYGYGWSDSPWFSHREFITEVVIPEGVTNIGEGIFWDCTGLAEITIPAGVTSIDNYAFSGCRNLVAVSVPESVKSIGVYAFQNCNSLTAITIPEGVMSIGNNTFENCNSLIAITIPEGVMNIGSNAFFGCSGLTSIACNTTTPPAIEDQWSLYGVDKSIPVYVPVSAVAAYKEAERWKEFTNILPMGTFGDNLTWMLTAEGELIIEGTGVMPDYTQPWSDYKQSIKTITVGEGITVLGSAAFSGCGKCTEVNLPNSLTDIRYEAFFACSSLPSITLPKNVRNVGGRVFCDCGSLASVTLNEGLESLGGETFRACGALKSIEIPSSMKEIAGAFYECKHLASVTIPEGVQKIASGAFCYCNDMASLTLPASLTSIGGNAFRQCVKLAYIEARATTPPTIEGSDAFTEVDKNVPVYVPASSVEAYKAADYWSLFANIQPMIIASGTCGENLTWKYIDGGKLLIEGTGEMFDYSNNSAAPWQNYKGSIKSIDIKDGVTSVGSWAFSQCPILTDVSIAESVTSIGGDAFRECIILEEITLPKGLTELGTGVFLYCSALKSVTVPEGVTKIGSDTFEFCPQLSSITFPSGLTEIGAWALKGAYNLTSITCKAATPPSLGNEVFSGVNTETPIYVPASSVEAYKTAYGWNQFANIQPIILASGTCGDDLAWKLTDEGELTIEGTGAMTDYEPHSAPWFAYKDEIKTVTIKPGVTTIGKYAIGDCSNLTTVTIPEGVTSIGLQAFQYCYKLTSVTLSDGLKTIDWGAFAECHELPSIDIPEGVTTIGNYAFTHCYKLSTVTIPESVTTIGMYAFRHTAITSVVIPANISYLSQGTFEDCPHLASITCKATTPPSVGHFETFYNVHRGIPVYVPVSAVDDYKEADYWKEFTNIQAIPEIITINQYGSGTYCSEYALDFSKVEGLKAYAATGYDTETGIVTLTRVMTAKAGTGLFVKGEPGEYAVPVMESTSFNTLNMLVGILEETQVNEYSSDGLYRNYRYTTQTGNPEPLFCIFEDGSSFSKNRAYLQIPVAWISTTAKSISMRFDDGETTEIENSKLKIENSTVIFDLMGRRVKNPVKGGIYIVNGKKVIW